MLFKFNIFYIIGKFLKLKYLNWSCFLNLRLWAKNYGTKNLEIKFSNVLFLWIVESFPHLFPPRRKALGNLTPNFLFVILFLISMFQELSNGIKNVRFKQHFFFELSCQTFEILSPKNFNPFLFNGTWLRLSFCFHLVESPFVLKTFNLKKLPKGVFFSRPFGSWKDQI
jgi:hypothetical protein